MYIHPPNSLWGISIEGDNQGNTAKDWLSEKEIEVYVFLGKAGPKKVSEITKHLRMNKGQVYRLLKCSD